MRQHSCVFGGRGWMLVCVVGLAAGCADRGGSGARSGGEEPDTASALTAQVVDQEAGATARNKAIDEVWARGETSGDRAAARESLKLVIWKGGAPSAVRGHALAKLLSDSTPEGQADNRKLLRLRLPTEAQWPVITSACNAIIERASDPAWKELTGALVRSYARRVPVPVDADRPERGALLALHPGQSVEQVLFQTYLKPEGEAGPIPGQTADIVEKQRQASWELLGRLDPDGRVRAAMLAGASASDPALAPIQKAASDLRVVPVTGSELAWVKLLLDSADPSAAAWWANARDAVAKLGPGQAEGLQLRHIEPVRWASAHRPEWLSKGRADLLGELGDRLRGRRLWRKSEGLGSGALISKEALGEWADQLVWGDVLCILTIDDAIKDPRVVASLLEQEEADRSDSSTEYGGGLWATDAVPGAPTKPKWGVEASTPGFVAHGYAARPAQRINDRTFVASDEMFSAEGAGGRALAHYHFHAQSVNNSAYAGPGQGDFEYAMTHGRACVVFTSVRKGVLDADYYQRNGACIDLGEVSIGR